MQRNTSFFLSKARIKYNVVSNTSKLLSKHQYFILHFIFLWKYLGLCFDFKEKKCTNRVKGRSQIRNPWWILQTSRRDLVDPGANRPGEAES